MDRSTAHPATSQHSAERRGYALAALLAGCVALAALGAWWWLRPAVDDGADKRIVLHTVKRDDFALNVTERGEIESAGVTEVVSEVKAKNTAGVSIIKIVPEGTVVKEGDFLVELDSSLLREERATQLIIVNSAEALVVQSRNVYETALIAKEEYLDGTYVQERQTIESEVFVAEENLNRAIEYYEFSKRLAAKGYINQLQLEADRFAVEKSRKELAAAQTKLKVLDDYTRTKMLKQLESDIITSQAKWEADKKSYEIEVEKLRELEDQIAKCIITAPKDGVVTYAHDRRDFGGDSFVVKEGAVIRERQAIIRLPDPDSMRVALNVNESLIQYVRPGMPATISPVGMGDVVLSGTVEGVNQYAEPSGWRKANVKEYKAKVSIDDRADFLRSGMTASVTIRCAFVPGAIQAPVQAVYVHDRQYFVFVHSNGTWEARAVKAGPNNEIFFVIEDGLAEGEQIAMAPRQFLDEVKLPEPASDRSRQTSQRGPRRLPEAAVAGAVQSPSGGGVAAAGGR
ncbi:MAG TPA: HlyD family efflux transporter periplasmic adaptor subunit [Lacipirellulaceae bacterium]|nr:HlyD family efflux transporter periplasmic adaptor subunit [Lacipirellulaceae bacterium]HMP04753.1 HlyD family efflux transporter periplasmic adaptor subunit [Lacipirellulaceae bacterium]